MKVTEKKISDLKMAGYNARTMTQKQEKDLTESIKSFGFVDPIIINSHPKRRNIIIGGHQRFIIAKRMKLKTIPCVEFPLTMEKERELNIRLNRNNGQWNPKLLQEHFDITDLLNWGFEKKELDFDIPDIVDKTSSSKKVRANVEVQFQLGDVRFTLPQSVHIKWIDSLAKKVGLKKESQVEEIKRRLQIPLKVKG
ncbi:MAG: ParB N-terminal domain-containing protein [Bacteroidota bacterium]